MGEKMLNQRRVPESINVHAIDPQMEFLIVDACEKLIKGSNPRRCRRIAGLLGEFTALTNDPRLVAYYRRAAMEVLLAAIEER